MPKWSTTEGITLLEQQNPTNYPHYVPPEINKGSKYLVVAEAPGEVEVDIGRPLVGPTGKLFDGFLETAKLPRTWFDLTNVCPWRPPENRLSDWIDNGDERIALGREALDKLLASRKYDGILALGWYSLLNLVGKRGITEHRGSIYLREDGTPVLGTFHPAKLFDEPKLANIIFRDVFKFRKMVTEGIPFPPARNLLTYPTKEQALAWYTKGLNQDWIACDIESDTETKELTEVGFAWSGTDAMCIKMGEPWTWELVQIILASARGKVFHNAPFDVPFLKYTQGWDTEGDIHDTLLMHHVLYPEFPADLAFCASIYTDEPYWKDLSKQDDDALKQRYNALDVAVTAELFPLLEKKLKGLGLYETYSRDRSVIRPAIDMSLRGVPYDLMEHNRLRDTTGKKLARWQKVLTGRAKQAVALKGEQGAFLLKKMVKGELNAMSPIQVQYLLYDLLGLPVQYNKDHRNRKKATTKQTKLLNLYPNITDKLAKKTLRALVMVRYYRKFRSTYLKEKPLCGSDGRIRTSFGVGRAETGRWTASTFLIDMEGANLQTIPPMWKSCFAADKGKLLFNADYSQIEARLVAYDAQDIEQIKIFESGGDIHKVNAGRMLKKPPEQVTPAERQNLGKSVHALNYKIGADALAEYVNKRGLETGIFLSKQFTAFARTLYLNTFDKVVTWQQRQWKQVKETRVLTNHLGRRRIFTGPTKGQFARATEGEAIAFVPQSDVPDMLNIAILRIVEDKTMQDCGVELFLQEHDALVGQGDADKVEIWVPRLKELMKVPLTIHGRLCIVPTDVAVGPNWKAVKKV